MKKRYRGIVIGCGKVGVLYESEPRRAKPASHAGVLAIHPKTTLVALVDTDKKALVRAGKIFPQAELYTNAAKAIREERPDVVVIATPPSARADLVGLCARYRVPVVVCEKPIATSAKAARKVTRIVRVADMTFVLNYPRRFSPLFERVRRDIGAGKLGRVQSVACAYSNGLYNNGGHSIDAIPYLLNDGIVSVMAVQNPANRTHPVDDMNVEALMTTKKGTTIILQSLDQRSYGIHDIRILGEKGEYALLDYGAMLAVTPARPSAFKGVAQLDRARVRITHAGANSFATLEHALRCREGRVTPRSGIENGVRAMEILDALRTSARHGGKRVFV